MKVDICIPSLKGVSDKYLENIRKVVPVNRILVERSRPVGVSRQRCIEWVETDFFVFLDDDCILKEGWFDEMFQKMDKLVGLNVGLIGTVGQFKGLGKVEKSINQFQGTQLRKLGDRGVELCASLCKNEAFKGWISPLDLSAYEDFILTNYIISKGYAWVKVDSDKVDHNWSWDKVKSNGLWAGKNSYRMYPSKIVRICLVLKCLYNLLIFYYRFLIGHNVDITKYQAKQNFYFAIGVAYSCLKH
jgi:glycosyltransferase involved in cell wall biosynthesis